MKKVVILYFYNLIKMKKIAILAGGNSGEHDISLQTAQNIFSILDKNIFIPYFIHIKGKDWNFINEKKEKFPIDKNDFSLTLQGEKIQFDAIFNAIHGTPGEDGKLQGYFDMLNIPYTGCDLFSSALTFNKFFCNITVKHFGIPIYPSLHFYKNDKIDYDTIIQFCQFPCFIKPCNSGSSVGITKAHNREELVQAMGEAFRYDEQLMVEKFIEGKEVTCGVGRINGQVKSLAVTEITSENEFYDFESKYTDHLHAMETPANISSKSTQKIIEYSEIIYQRLGCKGVVRIDYIVTPNDEPIFLEINTIPGQTSMSIIPHQIEYLGMNLSNFYTEIILEALSK